MKKRKKSTEQQAKEDVSAYEAHANKKELTMRELFSVLVLAGIMASRKDKIHVEAAAKWAVLSADALIYELGE